MEVPFVFDNDPSSRVLQAKLIQQQAKERLIKAEEEARLAEQEALIAEEQARIANEEAKLAEIKRIEEENRIIEEARLNEIKRIEEENRIAEEARLNEIKRIEEENRIAEEARITEIKRKEEEAWILIKEDFSQLSKIAKEKRMTYEEEFDDDLDDFNDRLEEIEENIKLVDNSKEYMSNILLKFTSGLCKKIHTTETPVNPILKELSGFVVEYYQEQKDLPEILNPRKKLKDIQKEILSFIENHTKLQNDIQIYKSDIYIKDLQIIKKKYLQDLQRIKSQKIISEKIIEQHQIDKYNISYIFYENDKKIKKIEEENLRFDQEITKKIDKHNGLALKHFNDRILENKKKLKELNDIKEKNFIFLREFENSFDKKILENIKRCFDLISNDVNCPSVSHLNFKKIKGFDNPENLPILISKLDKIKENEELIKQLPIKEQEIEDNYKKEIKEFYDFEFKLRSNISLINFDEYIIYITEKYNLEKDIHQKWSLDLIKKLEPHKKKIIDLQKLFT